MIHCNLLAYVETNKMFGIVLNVQLFEGCVNHCGEESVIKRINDLLAGLPMTIVAGVFLLFDLIPHLAGEFSGDEIELHFLPFDPAWITVMISGIPLLYLAVWRIVHNKGISRISSALLISIAMFAAIAVGDLFAAGEVAFIMAIGALLEESTTDRAKKGLRKLIDLAPTKGRRINNDGHEELVAAEDIGKDDILRIFPGETIPTDGVIIKGETSVDQSIMTGESIPVDKTAGDSVFCGTINRFGSIDIRATSVSENSSLQKLIRMVEDAEKKQAPMQRIADKAASYLVPIALLIAIIAYIATGNIVTAVTVLVVFCPCALVLATPTAIMAAIGQATKHGVIIKSGEALEKMGKVDTIAFDKTGTLTYGRLEISDIAVIDSGMNEDHLLSLAASAESRSEHPLGKAIVEGARSRGIEIKEAEDFMMFSGRGIGAAVDSEPILCGSERFISENGISICGEALDILGSFRSEGKASILVASGKSVIGIVALSDVMKENAKDMVSKLSAMNAETVLLTGDNRKAADYLASKIGIKEVRAELLPEEKVLNIEAMRKAGHKVCMIGDGVNDAPALKSADVSVAMGSMGSDIAIDAADIALMSDDISKIPYLKRLSNATVKTIKASITLSMCINAVAIILSLLGLLNPTTGALVHNAGSCFVVLIAALLYDRKFE